MLDPLLQGDENPLQIHYSDFDVANRILLSGHSHQAWPDVARHGQMQAYLDAATFVDDKWEAAFAKADDVRNFYANLMKEPDAEIALAGSTHELLIRFLSCLPFRKHSKPKIVTTNAEFHAMRRQLDRLAEEGVEIERVELEPMETLDQRLCEVLDQETIAVMVSGVFFETGQIFSNVGTVATAAADQGIPCLVDLYHVLNIVPFDIAAWNLRSAFLVGGGYKYLQAGEGNCFMRVPVHHKIDGIAQVTSAMDGVPANHIHRPVITGWFAEFATLNKQRSDEQVGYGLGHSAFAGSTYDPTSHYRAASVFKFFQEQQLTDIRLRNINQQQLKMLSDGISKLSISPDTLALPPQPLEDLGGFLPLQTDIAEQWVKRLKENGISSDSRGRHLRLGPAPYVSRKQIEQTIEAIGTISKRM
ncbi:kynureninase [bacterium]|nr:kynureninase [bacterium]